MKKLDTIVFIGRCEPPHTAHIEIIKRAAALANQVVVIVGSSYQPRTYKNPFTADERVEMIKQSTRNLTVPVKFEYIRDHLYNDQLWVATVQELVNRHTLGANDETIGIIGHTKDDTSGYLSMFPQWDRIEVERIEPLHATDIRDIYFRNDVNLKYLTGVVPTEVLEFLDKFKDSPEFAQIVREREFVAAYKKQFEGLAYPPVFVTADAVVVQSGHVLLIKRKAEPGKGLFALPGGFLNASTDTSVVEAAIRELKEETGIKVPVPVLRGSIKHRGVYDAITRSARGRTITHAVLIALEGEQLPKVKGSDDAEKAFWVPIADLDSANMFEDHYDVIRDMLGKL